MGLCKKPFCDIIFEMTRNKIIGVIPARWKSSRFPGKPLVDILGKSLIRRTYEQASASACLDELVVATDDERILEHVIQFGGKACLTSPSCPNGSHRVYETISAYFPDASIVVNIQGDEPCLNHKVIDSLVNSIKSNDESVVTTPICKITNSDDVLNPNVVKTVFDTNKRALYFSRSPIPFYRSMNHGDFYRHLGVYCFRYEFLERYVIAAPTRLQTMEDLEQLKILELGYPIHVVIVDDFSIGVDTPEDVKKVEEILCANTYS